MIFEDFTDQDRRTETRQSQLAHDPLPSYESFNQEAWLGNEAQWLRLVNLVHWTLSYLAGHDKSTLLLVQPDSPHVAENLSPHVDDLQICSIPVEDDASHQDITTVISRIEPRIASLAPGSVAAVLVCGLFSSGASQRSERSLLDSCRRVLKPGRPLLATFPLQDRLGNPNTALNVQFLNAAAGVGYEQQEIKGCEGIAAFLNPEFWATLRAQGFAAFDAVVPSLTAISDSPATVWMSQTAFYAGIRR